jgi:WbqC-like protein
MRIAIMQPTYLPWEGYFALMKSVDLFILLDNVEFSKQSWQQRNRIRGQQGEIWLTVPVKQHNHQLIKDVEINNASFAKKHLRSIEMNYGNAPFFNKYFNEITNIFNVKHYGLCDLNCSLINWLRYKLEITTKMQFASDIITSDDRIERLVDICKAAGANHYISPIGAHDYLEPQVATFKAANIAVEFFNYQPAPYKQCYEPYISHLSIIDRIMNSEIPLQLTTS